jgi:Fic family protein
VRGNQATPGEFRRSQNWIGPPGSTLASATYVPPPPSELVGCLGAWEKFLHESRLPPLVTVALAHYQFEAIHPFLDGNGRIGRLVIALFLVEREVLPSPLLYLSAFFEAARGEYYDHLLGVSERGAWAAWLEYFLAGVAHQAADALHRAERINALLGQWRLELAGSQSKVAVALVDLLAENPYWSIKRIAERLQVAYTTAQRAVEKLASLGILVQTTESRRDRIYCAEAILDILEEPADLGSGAG